MKKAFCVVCRLDKRKKFAGYALCVKCWDSLFSKTSAVAAWSIGRILDSARKAAL